jgi:DNA-binding CsgD family transcriptional regulator
LKVPRLIISRVNSGKKTALPNAVLGRHTGRLTLKRIRVFPKQSQQDKKRESDRSNPFVFCDKSTGVTRFQAETVGNSDSSLERMAGLLAMQCLVRGHEPDDFMVLVPAERVLVDRLVSRAKELLDEGRAISGPPNLSPRQKEILHSVLCNKANKEIASNLNITVRTVKFHISTLLSKFAVENRLELAQRATGFLRPSILDRQTVPDEQPFIAQGHTPLGPMRLSTTLRDSAKGRSVRFPGRVLTA